MAQLCEDEEVLKEDVGESIFEPGSRMGLQSEEPEDYWIHDATAATWTRMVIVPRREYYYPEEETVEHRGDSAPCVRWPVVSSLRDARLTIPKGGKALKDNWRAAAREDGPWRGRRAPVCVV